MFLHETDWNVNCSELVYLNYLIFFIIFIGCVCLYADSGVTICIRVFAKWNIARTQGGIEETIANLKVNFRGHPTLFAISIISYDFGFSLRTFVFGIILAYGARVFTQWAFLEINFIHFVKNESCQAVSEISLCQMIQN